MPDPVMLRQQVVPKLMGGGDMLVIQSYEAPGCEMEDPWKENDMRQALEMERILFAAYPGYPWKVKYDTIQGYAFIMLPTLMGEKDGYMINLKTHEVTPQLVKTGGGLILEIYRQHRGPIHLGNFLDARREHSKLVVPGRPIPV